MENPIKIDDLGVKPTIFGNHQLVDHHYHHFCVEVSVNIREVAAQRPLVGGFSIAQRVQASMSLVVGSKVRGAKYQEFFFPFESTTKKTERCKKNEENHTEFENLRTVFPLLSFLWQKRPIHPDFWRWWCMQDAEELFWRSLAIHVSQLFLRHPRQAHPAASTSCRCWVGNGSFCFCFSKRLDVDLFGHHGDVFFFLMACNLYRYNGDDF